MSWNALPVELQHQILYYLPETQDLKSCRLVARDWKKAVDEVSKRILSALTLESCSETAFTRARALEHLIELWRIKPNIYNPDTGNYSDFILQKSQESFRMLQRAALADCLLKKLPHFSSLYQIVSTVTDKEFIAGENDENCRVSDLLLTSLFFPKHPANKDLETIVLNHTLDLLNAVAANNSAATEYLLSEKGGMLDSAKVICSLYYAAEHDLQDYFFKILHYAETKCIPIDKKELKEAAAMGGNLEIIKSCDSEAETSTIAILYAAEKRLDVFQYLWNRLENKDPLQHINPHHGGLAHMAASGNAVEVLNYLQEMNMPFDQPLQQSEGNFPIHVTARCGSYEAAKFLLDQGAPIDSQTLQGRTSLMIAAFCGHSSLIDLFLEKNADVTLTHNNWGRSFTALDYAYEYGLMHPEKEDRFEGVKLILERTSFWNKLRYLKIFTWKTPLSYRLIVFKSLVSRSI